MYFREDSRWMVLAEACVVSSFGVSGESEAPLLQSQFRKKQFYCCLENCVPREGGDLNR
jgi:hypothetical protein